MDFRPLLGAATLPWSTLTLRTGRNPPIGDKPRAGSGIIRYPNHAVLVFGGGPGVSVVG